MGTMKDIKNKSSYTDSISGGGTSVQKNTQATEEQMRYAKLAQVNTKDDDRIIQEKMREVFEITRIPPDIVSIALHDCDYDTSQAIQNILEGRYAEAQGEWKTTATRKGKKPSTPVANTSTNHTPEIVESTNNIDHVEEQRPAVKSTRLLRGGSSSRGRSSSRNWRNNDKIPNDEKFDPPPNVRENSRDRSVNDRGRGRGRGKNSRGGGVPRGGRGSRGGFGRGGSSRGSGRQRGGFSRAADNRKEEIEETWGLDAVETNNRTEDWADDIVDDSHVDSPDWSKDDWSNQRDKTSTAQPTDSLFARDSSLNWSHVNGKDQDTWNEDSSVEDRGKYLPESIDTAVIRSIPTSSTAGEVTSYQPTNDISRYLNSASNQFPSSHQEGGLTSSLNDRAFSLPKNVPVSADSNKRTSMPIVSGVTESHKLEQEQLRLPKTQRHHKPRKAQNKYMQFPSQPVVMPRSAQMVNDVEEQFMGLEFGSGPLSPRINKAATEEQPTVMSSSSTNHQNSVSSVSTESSSRHPVATLQSQPLLSQTSQGHQSQPMVPASKLEPVIDSNPIASKSDMPKTPPGFKPLDQSSSSHYLNSPGRGLTHMTSETIPFPSSANRTSPTASSSSLNVFSLNGGLGTSVSVTEQQLKLSSFNDQQVYDHLDQNINAQKIMADQKALAEKQYLAERERELIMANQRAFAEQKSLAQQKLMTERRLHEDKARTDRLSAADLSDQRNTSDLRRGLNESPLKNMQSTADSTQLGSNDSSYLASKVHNKPGESTTLPPPPGVMPPSSYSSTTVLSNEMLGLTSATGVQTTAKMQASANKSPVPPGVLPLNLAQYPGVQPVIPAYQHQQMHGYNYEELLQMHRMPVSPYYDLSMFQPAGTAGTTRDGIQTYQASESKFTRGTDESSPVSIPQGNPHVAAGSLPTHQQAAYLNATGQLPYGYTYTYQPGVIPQGGVYPTFTAPSVYQVTQAKGVGATQYPSQYQTPTQQGGYNSTKYSGSSGHEFQKGNYHSSAAAQPTLGPHGKASQHSASSSTVPSSAQAGIQSTFKTQYQDVKGYLGNSPSSLNSMHMHNQQQAAHMQGNINPYLMQQHTNLMAHGGQVSTPHLGHHQQQQQHQQQQMDAGSHRSQVHGFNGNSQKRDQKGSYQSYWSGSR